MKLKEWLDDLNAMIEKNPELLNYEICTSSDDEGNSYNAVYYNASTGIWTEDDEFISDENIGDETGAKVICLN